MTWDAESLRSRVADPILSAMLTPEELQAATVAIEPGQEDGWLLLRLTVHLDQFVSYLYQPPVMTSWSAREIGEKLADELHDFVAESQFGWGQNRSAGSAWEASHHTSGGSPAGQSG
jgi:hypothetical protein